MRSAELPRYAASIALLRVAAEGWPARRFPRKGEEPRDDRSRYLDLDPDNGRSGHRVQLAERPAVQDRVSTKVALRAPSCPPMTTPHSPAPPARAGPRRASTAPGRSKPRRAKRPEAVVGIQKLERPARLGRGVSRRKGASEQVATAERIAQGQDRRRSAGACSWLGGRGRRSPRRRTRDGAAARMRGGRSIRRSRFQLQTGVGQPPIAHCFPDVQPRCRLHATSIASTIG